MRQLDRPVAGEAASLACSVCSSTRPVICANCHATTLKALRVGAQRAAEELSALVGTPTMLVDGETTTIPADSPRVLVGTEAVLHRVASASLVIFLDFDQHLLASRFGAHEEALSLLARAGRLSGGRLSHGKGAFVRRVVVQTRIPDHEVIKSAIEGDPGLLRASEITRRSGLRLPPYSAIALISGEASGSLICALQQNDAIEVAEFDTKPATAKRPASTRSIVRAPNHEILCGALTTFIHEGPGLRIEVDPTAI